VHTAAGIISRTMHCPLQEVAASAIRDRAPRQALNGRMHAYLNQAATAASSSTDVTTDTDATVAAQLPALTAINEADAQQEK
jgi:hypothetical protein